MTKTFAFALASLAAVAASGCGGVSTRAAQSCFDIWNGGSNKALQARVAERFRSANVTNWTAQASGGDLVESWTASSGTVPAASGGGNVGGGASRGCGYLFHTSKRFVSFSAELEGGAVHWNVPPPIRGSWSRRQQAATRDNARVDAGGLLSPRSAG